MSYRVILSPAVRRQLDKLRIEDIAFLDKYIVSLAEDPYPNGARKLKGIDLLRIRVRNYRLIYSVKKKEKQVYIEKIARRNERTYKGF